MTARSTLAAALLGLWLIAGAAAQDGGTSRGTDASPTEPGAEQLVFLLEYVGTDYGLAVRDGAVVDPLEYDEMLRFTATLVEGADVLVRQGAPVDVAGELVALRALVTARRPWHDVLAHTTRLSTTLLGALDVLTVPTARPDPRRGAPLYRVACAACHGPDGGGDGPAAPGLEPPASSFRDARVNLLSPHQIRGAIRFGIEGTSMPAYGETLRPEEIWDLAFFVPTLRADFDPSPSATGLPITLDALATTSNNELVRRLRTSGWPVGLADIDAYRQTPPPFTGPGRGVPERVATAPLPGAVPTEPGAAETSPRAAADESFSLQVALDLQDAFAAVADEVLPSVVSVSAFVRREAHPAHASAAAGAAADAGEPPVDAQWEAADPEERLYPGFRRLRSGSGFFVSSEGHLLTCLSALAGPDGEPAPVIDVELTSGRHVLSRLVGAEPTLDLAVVQVGMSASELPPSVRPVTIGDADAMRVGHWAIAVGDPWGPEQTYAVGTLAASASRQCYQEDLTGTLLQASVSIPVESLGGPLVDIRGRVVGMTVPARAETAGALPTSQLALPIGLAMNLYEALLEVESRKSPWLGFSVLELGVIRRSGRDASLPMTGVYIDDVFTPSPASEAGLRVGDSLVSLDGQRLLSVLGFQRALYLAGIGRSVPLEVFREGETFSVQVTIGERPESIPTR